MRDFFIVNLVLNIVSIYLFVLVIGAVFFTFLAVIGLRSEVSCTRSIKLDKIIPSRTIACYLTEPSK